MSWKPYLSYVFPPFCLISRILQKIHEEKATVIAVVPHWPTQVWWPQMIALLIRHPIILPNTKTTVYLPSNPDLIHPLYPRLHLLLYLLSGDLAKIREFQLQLPTSSSVRGGTGPLNNINLTSVNGNHTAVRATVVDGMNFLAELFQSGAGYSAVSTARSALSSILMLPGNTTFGSHPLVSRLLTSVFELRPALPKYQSIWDISVILNVLECWPIQNISLKHLSLKLTMLLALATSQRVQTLHALTISNMTLRVNECVFVVDSVLKATKPGKHLTNIQIHAFADNKNLCPVEHLKQYLDKISVIRGLHTQLLLSYQKPHRPVSTDTIARCIKVVLTEAGINTSVFSAHSTRAASTSAAYNKGIRIDKILAAADWSTESTFSRFYRKPIVSYRKLFPLRYRNYVDVCISVMLYACI